MGEQRVHKQPPPKRRSGWEGRTNRWAWTTLNDADKAAAIRLLALGLSVSFTARRIGRTPDMIYKWATDDPDFAAALNALNSEIDSEVLEYRQRVRRVAGEMLDNLIELAGTGNPNQRERNTAARTFFADVYGPEFAPRTKDGTGVAPVVLVNAEQAALLFPAARPNESASADVGGSDVGPPWGPEGDRGAGAAARASGGAGDDAGAPGQVAGAGGAEAGEDGGDSGGADAGDIGGAVGEGVGGG